MLPPFFPRRFEEGTCLAAAPMDKGGAKKGTSGETERGLLYKVLHSRNSCSVSHRRCFPGPCYRPSSRRECGLKRPSQGTFTRGGSRGGILVEQYDAASLRARAEERNLSLRGNNSSSTHIFAVFDCYAQTDGEGKRRSYFSHRIRNHSEAPERTYAGKSSRGSLPFRRFLFEGDTSF